MCFCLCSGISINNGSADGFHSLNKTSEVNVIHASGVLNRPVNHAGVVKVVCKTALDKVISVNVLLHADKAGLFLRRCPQRDDWERRIIPTITNNRPVNAAFCNDLLIVSLFVQNLDLLVLLFDIIGVSVKFKQRCPQRLIVF